MAAQAVAALMPWAITLSNCEPNAFVPINMVIRLPARPCAQAAFQTSFKEPRFDARPPTPNFRVRLSLFVHDCQFTWAALATHGP
jgi:hypothetical protein